MAKKTLPAGTVECLDWIHDPHQLTRRQVARDLKMTENQLRKARPDYEYLWQAFHPCNLMLLPDLSAALACYAEGLAELREKGKMKHPSYDVAEMAKRIDGTLCHLNPEQIAACEALSSRLAEAVRALRPSLNATPRTMRAEVADLWDAGLIAQGDDRPCFDYRYDGAEPAKGAGEGAFRVLCNTDTAYGRSDGENLATALCMVNVLQTFGPVEIWTQQGWLSCGQKNPVNRSSGVTCFRVGQMGSISPAALAFWMGSPYRDNPFSNIVNKALGRTCGGTSTAPAIPCDIFNLNGTGHAGTGLPSCEIALTEPNSETGKAEIAAMAEHLAEMLCGIIYPDATLDQ